MGSASTCHRNASPCVAAFATNASHAWEGDADSAADSAAADSARGRMASAGMWASSRSGNSLASLPWSSRNAQSFVAASVSRRRMASGLSPQVGDARECGGASSDASSSDASSPSKRGTAPGVSVVRRSHVADGGSGRDSSHPASVTRSSSRRRMRSSTIPSSATTCDVETRYGLDASPDSTSIASMETFSTGLTDPTGSHVVSSAASARIRTTRAPAPAVPPITADHTARARASDHAERALPARGSSTKVSSVVTRGIASSCTLMKRYTIPVLLRAVG